MAKWLAKENNRSFWLEANFLTRLGVQRELQQLHFVRIPHDPNNLKSYIRYWPGGVHAIARIYPRIGMRRVRVTITYYDNKGRKHRKLPTARK
jgi:hypothetical protein